MLARRLENAGDRLRPGRLRAARTNSPPSLSLNPLPIIGFISCCKVLLDLLFVARAEIASL
jgi:hypothetical protein